MSDLQRVTTLFVPAEDRIRLAGEVAGGDARVLWLTRRLADRLVPVLVGWLEEQVAARDVWQGEVMQAFAQQAASAALVPQVPVSGESATASWLVSEVDVVRGEQRLDLRFKGAAGEQVSLALVPQALRQWLGILHAAYRQADWPVTVWPQWLREAGEPVAARSPGVMH